MLCLVPFKRGMLEFGCGQCMPCRINRARLWTCRLMLEAAQHQCSLFVTMTFNKEHYPVDDSVNPRDLQLFVKRVRERVFPNRVRFFGVGEYGERRGRPHYHCMLFGSVSCADVGACWSFGDVHVGTVTPASARYVAGYVVKGLTKKDDVRLKFRRPEFARMSLRPGIGALDLSALLRVCEAYGVEDVPAIIRAENKKWPLGRYLRQKMRVELGRAREEPEYLVARRVEELRAKFVAMSTSEVLLSIAQQRRQAGWKAWRLKQIADSRKESKSETV